MSRVQSSVLPCRSAMLGSRAHYAARPSRAAASNLPLRRHRVLPVTAGSSHHHASEQSRTRAYPERRTSSFSTIRSPVLRSLARRTVPISRETLEERYGAPLLVGGKAASQQQQMSAISYAPTASQQRLPRLLQPQQQADAAAVEESPLARDALVLILLATAVSFVCSIDRAAMSVAILPMSDQFNWDDTVKGSVSSAFFAGYMITNLCGGFLATRYSAKHVLASGVVLWSLFTIATPAAAAGNLGELMLARAMMGVGEGVTYPSIQNLVRQRVPEQKRSRALAFIYSGHQLGTIGSYLLCPLLIAHLGWESVFWIFGALGFVWLAGWLPLVSDRYQPPAPAPKLVSGASSARGPAPGRAMAVIPAAAASAAVAEAPAAPAEQLRLQDVPWASFAANPAFWAIVAAQCTVSVGNVLAFSWLPTFYNQVYGVDVAGSAAYSVLPFVVTVLATNAGGWIADGLVNNGVIGKTHTRKLMQAIASLGPAVCLLQLAANHGGGEGAGGNVTDAVALVTAWCSLSGFSAAGYGSNHQDISKQYSGILYGLANGLASVAASASIYATGQVLHYTHDWSLVFEVAAGLNVVGALAYLKWASSDEQFATAAQPATTKAKAQ